MKQKLLSKINRECLVLFFVLIAAWFLRVYKLDQLLSFYYDQGRDALVVWDLLHKGKFFMIGPVTGIEGVFLGPFYYYLLTPLYFLGRGSPIFVAVILNLISVVGIYLLYLIAKEFFDKKTAFLAAILTTFSYTLVVFSRWLSHPPLLPTFSLAVIYALLQIYRGHKNWWLAVGLLAGLCLQLEAASAVFFLPTILIFFIWQRKKQKNFIVIVAAFLLFLATLAPQAIFNWRHQGVLLDAFRKFLVGEKSFYLPLWQLMQRRLTTYFVLFLSRFFYAQETLRLIWFGIFLVLGFLKRKEIFAGERKILGLWFFVPLTAYLFYQGNQGYFWDYYLSGVWSIFIIWVAFLLTAFWKNIMGKAILGVFLVLFFYFNISQLLIYYKIGIGITIRYQLLALDWIYKDAGEKNFNIDVYVPPVIPYAYNYLFKWYGLSKYGKEPLANNVSLLYTLYEADSDHPERLVKWSERQDKIGKILEQKTYGDITVQRRERI